MPDDPSVEAVARQLLSVMPPGITWVRPVTDSDGTIVDFRIAATDHQSQDVYGRGPSRLNQRLGDLYPSMVGGPLWELYRRVLATGEPGRVSDFRYHETRAGIVADSLFDITVHPVLGGLLVSWHRIDEDQLRLTRTEELGRLGWAEVDLATGTSVWSPGVYRIFKRDPALGPMSLAGMKATVVADDSGLGETVWQTLDSGGITDVTVRFRTGDTVTHARIMADIAPDADGTPLKIYAVVQDVTAREDSSSEIERLRVQLRNREITALAEHRLAGQLQNLIQPMPTRPFTLAGLEAAVGYLPAESAVRVGGDWYHAQTLPDGRVVLAIGDVAGHGLESASGMAHLRYALVGWLAIGIADPATLLGHLNLLSCQLRVTGTAVVAVYEPDRHLLRWARAGHLPPIMARAGTANSLERPAGMLLGADADARYPVVEEPLRDGDLVLFFTDGLVERRDAPTTARIDQVRGWLAEISTDPGPQSLIRLRGLLHDPSTHDDTCTLAVRVLADASV